MSTAALTVVIALVCCIAAVSGQQVVPMPSQYYPPTTRPRVIIYGDIARIKQELTNTGLQDIQDWNRKLTFCISANVDEPHMWDYRNGSPAATCGLAYYIDGTNNATLLNCAKFWLGQFDGNPLLYGRLQPIYFYAMAYDLIYNGLTPAERASYVKLFIQWSDKEWSNDHPAGSNYYDADSDHNSAVWSSHLTAGVTIYSDDTANGIKLLNRAWTCWTVGLGGNPNLTTDWQKPIAMERLLVFANSGMNLPGFDYATMSDNRDIAMGFRQTVLLGIPVNATAAMYWLNMLKIIMQATTPDMLQWRPYGDFQSNDYDWGGESWCRSYLNPAIYWSQYFGYTQWASFGKYFRDRVCDTSVGRESDEVIALIHTNASLASVSPYTVSAAVPLIYVGNQGLSQMIYFRDSWASTATWGSFAGVSNRVDHLPPDAGGYHLWRGGEYLTVFPANYGGYLLQVFNTLYIPNTHSGTNAWNGNSLLAGAVGPNSIDRVRSQETSGIWMYAMANMDSGYNDGRDNPVSTYRRHFIWMSPDIAVVYDRVFLTSSRYTAYRYRSAHATIAPTRAGDTVRSLSSAGTYQLLTRFMLPSTSGLTFNIINEANLAAFNGIVDPSERRFGIVANVTAPASNYHWLVVHHISNAGGAQNVLSTASTITGLNAAGGPAWDGIFVLNNVFLFSRTETLSTTVSYAITSGGATIFHLIADMQPGCYVVTADGSALGSTFGVAAGDNTLAFTSTGNSFSIASTSAACSPPTPIPTASPPTFPPTTTPAATTTQPGATTTQPGSSTPPGETTTAPASSAGHRTAVSLMALNALICCAVLSSLALL